VDILDSDIEDTRPDEDLCGFSFMKADLERMNRELNWELERQLQKFRDWLAEREREYRDWFRRADNFMSSRFADFDRWFNDVRDTLSPDVGYNLLTQINQAALLSFMNLDYNMNRWI
jgi:hypothetical protein